MLSAPVHLLRLARIGFVLAREGAFGSIDASALPLSARLALRIMRLIERRKAGAGRLAAAMTRLGPNYVKLGQFLSTRPDIVGLAMARELESLQDRMPPFARSEAIAMIEASFAKPLESLFSRFGEPVAAASIAQVHQASLGDETGERLLAVKVLRPGVKSRFLADLETMRFAARLAEGLGPAMQRLQPGEVVETLARSVVIEMDLRLEAAAVSEFAQNTKNDTEIRVPAIDWDRTAHDVLSCEWIEGTPLSDLAALDAAGHDRVDLARVLIQSFLNQAMRDGFFHADLHQGNLFVDTTGRLVMVDFGIMGRLGIKERRFLAEILHGFITRDYHRVAEVHFEAGYVPARHSVADFAQAIRAIGEPIHARRADEISMAKLLTLLFEVTALFDMKTRPELVLLQKTMIVVEGVARSLDPKLDMWKTAEPVVRGWVERNLGPLGLLERAGEGVKETGHFLSGLPTLLNRAETLAERVQDMAERGVTLSPETAKAIGQAEARGNRGLSYGIWVIAALMLWWLLRG